LKVTLKEVKVINKKDLFVGSNDDVV